jgi:hypothetical protein
VGRLRRCGSSSFEVNDKMTHAEAAPEPPQVNGSRKKIHVYWEGISLARAFSGCGSSGRLG